MHRHVVSQTGSRWKDSEASGRGECWICQKEKEGGPRRKPKSHPILGKHWLNLLAFKKLKYNVDQVSNEYKTLPLSNNTVKHRKHWEHTCWKKIKIGPFSIRLNETTTLTEETILIVYVQYTEETDLKQDILMSVNLTATARGEGNFSVADMYFTKNNLPSNNLVAWRTNCAASRKLQLPFEGESAALLSVSLHDTQTRTGRQTPLWSNVISFE